MAPVHLFRFSANLLGLAHRFPSLGPAPAVVARELLRTPDPAESGAWDETVLGLMYWAPGGILDLGLIPTISFAFPDAVPQAHTLCGHRPLAIPTVLTVSTVSTIINQLLTVSTVSYRFFCPFYSLAC